jgi:hypothetical protein
MEAARISETSVDNCFTRQYIPEDNSELHTRRRENLKSHFFVDFQVPHTERRTDSALLLIMFNFVAQDD